MSEYEVPAEMPGSDVPWSVADYGGWKKPVSEPDARTRPMGLPSPTQSEPQPSDDDHPVTEVT